MTAPDRVVCTVGILSDTLEAIRRDGWKPNSWGLVPPWCIRRALTQIVDRAYKFGSERDKANAAARQAISAALQQPIGLISHWESQPGRTQQDVENILEKAIAGVTG